MDNVQRCVTSRGKSRLHDSANHCQVHLGGHVQTGGYGQLGRSFGLLGDHVRSLEIIDHTGQEREITKAGDPEMFYACKFVLNTMIPHAGPMAFARTFTHDDVLTRDLIGLGGSPGNFGVLTHFTIQVHRDANYIGSRGLKAVHLYNTNTLKRLLQVQASMNDNENFPRNYDLCISVLSGSFDILGLMGGLDNKMQREHPEIFGHDEQPAWPRAIVVYAQWVPFSPSDKPDQSWFDQLRQNCWFTGGVREKPMSQLVSLTFFILVAKH